MDARIQALPFDPETLRGLSANLLRSHHLNNYGGAVKRLNAIRARLAATPFSTATGFELNGLKREELIATNSMLLHELHFGSLGGDATAMPPPAVDRYEHAYHMDFGAAAGAYVDAFMANIDWAAVYERYRQAVHAASESLGATPDEAGDALLLDARRAGVYQEATTALPAAYWRDPTRVSEWCSELPPDADVIVSCVYGHEVGRATALRLRALGVKARFLRGGIDGWQATGRPLVGKPAG